MAETKTETAKKENAIRFTKEQFVESEKYKYKVDVVRGVLKDDQTYTIEEVDKLIEDFYKTEV